MIAPNTQLNQTPTSSRFGWATGLLRQSVPSNRNCIYHQLEPVRLPRHAWVNSVETKPIVRDSFRDIAEKLISPQYFHYHSSYSNWSDTIKRNFERSQKKWNAFKASKTTKAFGANASKDFVEAAYAGVITGQWTRSVIDRILFEARTANNATYQNILTAAKSVANKMDWDWRTESKRFASLNPGMLHLPAKQGNSAIRAPQSQQWEALRKQTCEVFNKPSWQILPELALLSLRNPQRKQLIWRAAQQTAKAKGFKRIQNCCTKLLAKYFPTQNATQTQKAKEPARTDGPVSYKPSNGEHSVYSIFRENNFKGANGASIKGWYQIGNAQLPKRTVEILEKAKLEKRKEIEQDNTSVHQKDATTLYRAAEKPEPSSKFSALIAKLEQKENPSKPVQSLEKSSAPSPQKKTVSFSSLIEQLDKGNTDINTANSNSPDMIPFFNNIKRPSSRKDLSEVSTQCIMQRAPQKPVAPRKPTAPKAGVSKPLGKIPAAPKAGVVRKLGTPPTSPKQDKAKSSWSNLPPQKDDNGTLSNEVVQNSFSRNVPVETPKTRVDDSSEAFVADAPSLVNMGGRITMEELKRRKRLSEKSQHTGRSFRSNQVVVMSH